MKEGREWWFVENVQRNSCCLFYPTVPGLASKDYGKPRKFLGVIDNFRVENQTRDLSQSAMQKCNDLTATFGDRQTDRNLFTVVYDDDTNLISAELTSEVVSCLCGICEHMWSQSISCKCIDIFRSLLKFHWHQTLYSVLVCRART
jgi:hypothetical protein